MNKDLEYYLNLPYKIVIESIPEKDGGGFVACLPELGKHAIVGDGDTIEEALQSMNKIKEILLKEWLEDGVLIPEPKQGNKIDEDNNRHRKNPKESQVGGRMIDVLYPYQFKERSDLCGQSHYALGTIFLAGKDGSGNKYPKEAVSETFIHEILHCICHIYNGEEQLEEREICALSQGCIRCW